MIDPRSTFGEVAAAYAEARPRYPAALFEWLAAQAHARDTAWDCATGNGQAAEGLSAFFRRVVATDDNAAQIANAVRIANVTYSVAAAESSRLPSASADLITVAQALHWFDYEKFWPEVQRVGKPGALFAAWGYVWPEVGGEIDSALIDPVRELIAPFWAQNNRLLWNGYRSEDIRFPFARIEPPPFAIVVTWSFAQIVAYMQTWSSWRMASQEPAIAQELAEIVERARQRISNNAVFTARMPLIVAVGRVE